ncbi:acetyltransferase (GNAT) family protein [Knoellia remsis]|uniref:Acetyltransferase (GNAT) family protein n=1 Tax=Knoellia remsis TaxID=407159 RepID=A0A2T0UQS5_9MICO|nr:acetyltransferase (GNAT) family protein [Knoellia remsis]
MRSVSAAFDAVHIGARVVVRHRLDPAESAAVPGRPSLTDSVGELLERTPSAVVVATRRGPVTIPRDRIVAAKPLPPRPVRRGAPHRAVGIDDLQRTMVDAWPPMERERLGGWHLHASRGFTGRGNSALPLGDPGVPVDEAVTRTEQWYAARGLPSTFMVARPVGFDVTADRVGAVLLERGYTDRVPTLTLTASSRVVAEGHAPDVAVETGTELTDEWLEAMATYRRIDEVAARAILTGSSRQVFATVRDGGRPVAIGRLGEGVGWAGVAAMWVAPTHRRRGLARAVVGELARSARADGIPSLHLQTDSDNAAALTLYEGLGFERHHAYVYLTRPHRDP